MLRFLCEKQDNKIVHDFVFALTLAKDFYAWQHDERLTLKFLNYPSLMGTAVANPDMYVPAGSVAFVEAYLKQFYPKATKALEPLNVPECLFPFAGREIINIAANARLPLTLPKGQLYMKSNSKIKALSNGVAPPDADASAFLGHQVSQVIDVDSEWRAFVFHDKIEYIANYGGDPTIFPAIDTVKEMVKAFSPEAPVAYTLDVGVNWKQTFVIECHRFYSCGLYGFSDLKLLPKMLSQAWFEIKNTR